MTPLRHGAGKEAVLGRLLERDAELAALHATALDAAAGRGRVVLVAGEAGIGKSSLVEAWVRDPGGEARVLLGWCDDLLTSKTLGPFWDVARSVRPLAEAVERADTRAVIAAVLAELGYPLQPTVLLLEDLHWADEATLDVVRYVGRRITGLPAVLALTYRDDELDAEHPLRGVLGALPAAAVRRVRPRPLSRAGVAALTSKADLDPDEVLRVTGGNPFFVTELAHAGDDLPATVTDAVLARTRRLPPAARAAVEQLAVIPGAASRNLVERVLADAAALAPAEEHGLLEVDASHVRFRHELARRAVLEALPVYRRSAYARRVLDELLDADGEVAEILQHAVEARRGDVVAAYGPTAATAAFRAGAHRQAVVHHAHVLQYAEHLAPAEHARVLEEHAWALYNLVRFTDAAAVADEAVALRERLDDAAALARARLTQSRMRYMTNHVVTAWEALERALAAVVGGAGDDELRAEVLANRLALLNLTDRHADVVRDAPAVVALAERVGRPDLLVIAHQYTGWSRVHLGDVRGVAAVREAIAVGRRAAAADPAAQSLEPLARAYTNAIEIFTTLRDWSVLEALLDEALGLYDDFEFASHRYDPLANHGRMHLYRGAWTEAEQVLEGVRASVADAGILETYALAPLALLAVRSGSPRAPELMTRVWEIARASASGQYVVPAALPYLEWAWLTGAHDLDSELVAAACAAGRGTILHGQVLWRLAPLGLALDVPGGVGEPERTSLAGDWAGAAEGWAALDMPYERGLELLRSGMAEPTLEALRVFTELGAEPAARRARLALRALGVRSIPRGPTVATRDSPAGLTARQVEVLRLLAKGWTNAEIADRLVLSVRTVDHHVSAILEKLEVPSRRAAAGRAAELGLT